MSHISARELLQDTIHRLEVDLASEAEPLARYALEALFGLNRSDFVVDKSVEISREKMNDYEDVLQRLLNREPIQYIFGRAHFYGRWFDVTPDVLIPRQETEELIKLVVDNHTGSGLNILDVGTGSGCIACSLALELRRPSVYAIDISQMAVKVAASNAEKLACEVAFKQMDVIHERIPHTNFDIIVSNPPYVMESEKVLMNENVLDHEPSIALFVPDSDPLVYYRAILMKSREVLKVGGMIYFEINEQKGTEVAALASASGFGNVTVHRDINDKMRFVSGVYKG